VFWLSACVCDVPATLPSNLMYVSLSILPIPLPPPPLPPASRSCDVGEHEEAYVKGKAGRGG
jgi:hypothetical protein